MAIGAAAAAGCWCWEIVNSISVIGHRRRRRLLVCPVGWRTNPIIWHQIQLTLLRCLGWRCHRFIRYGFVGLLSVSTSPAVFLCLCLCLFLCYWLTFHLYHKLLCIALYLPLYLSRVLWFCDSYVSLYLSLFLSLLLSHSLAPISLFLSFFLSRSLVLLFLRLSLFINISVSRSLCPSLPVCRPSHSLLSLFISPQPI